MLLLQRAKDTSFGREHDFAEIQNLSDYQAKVPIRRYEDFEPYIQRMVNGEENVLCPDKINFFARSSGTTGEPKYIPIHDVYLTEFRKPRRVWMRQVMQHFPGLIRGKVLGVHSPKIEGITPGGVPYGSITVAMSGMRSQDELPKDTFGMEAVPRAVFLVDDFDTKYYLLLRFATQENVTLAATINPSTLVLIAQKLQKFAPRLVSDLRNGTLDNWDNIPDSIAAELRHKLKAHPRNAKKIETAIRENRLVLPTEIWPNLVGLFCWKGGNAPFYLNQLDQYFPEKRRMDFGYLASEGGMSLVLDPEGADGVVAVTGHIIEFIPEEVAESNLQDAIPLLSHQLEVGQRYRVIITGAHGLYRYDINDVVECVGYYNKTARIEFVHKGGNMLSVTGEKVGDSHVTRALSAVAELCNFGMRGFCVAVRYSTPPRYVFGVEPESEENEEDEIRRVLSACDEQLQKFNIEYAAKRQSQRLAAPQLAILQSGAFERERARRIKSGAPENHVKPRLLYASLDSLEALGVQEWWE
uniref:GH3 auxin-responsive promoter n=1 Tax=uncultured myxobacterium HF0070_11L13 TaxID=723554 RepID=E7C1Z6_9BACT|nr:hypothetical protein [uncultured myxobacterium HF0070_11L13]